jgi:hypothetical protein
MKKREMREKEIKGRGKTDSKGRINAIGSKNKKRVRNGKHFHLVSGVEKIISGLIH